MSRTLTVTVDGETHSIILDRLTLGEARAIERVTGMAMGDVAKAATMTAIQALLWVTLKRKHPELGFSDLDDRSFADFDLDVKDDDPAGEADPTEPSAEG